MQSNPMWLCYFILTADLTAASRLLLGSVAFHSTVCSVTLKERLGLSTLELSFSPPSEYIGYSGVSFCAVVEGILNLICD